MYDFKDFMAHLTMIKETLLGRSIDDDSEDDSNGSYRDERPPKPDDKYKTETYDFDKHDLIVGGNVFSDVLNVIEHIDRSMREMSFMIGIDTVDEDGVEHKAGIHFNRAPDEYTLIKTGEVGVNVTTKQEPYWDSDAGEWKFTDEQCVDFEIHSVETSVEHQKQRMEEHNYGSDMGEAHQVMKSRMESQLGVGDGQQASDVPQEVNVTEEASITWPGKDDESEGDS